MKVCIIGSTGHTGYVLRGLALRDDATLAGTAPGTPEEKMERLQKSADQYGLAPEMFGDYRLMLDAVNPDIVAVASHFNLHALIATEALERGMHVFVEKPVATTLDDLRMVKEAYRRSNTHLAAMFGSRCDAWYRTVRKLVMEGKIGDIRMMNAQKSYKLGKREELYWNRKTSGGTVPWVGSHAIDWMNDLCGEPFQSVYASHSSKDNHGHGDLEMTGLCHFKFGNEIFGSVSIDYLRPRQAPSHDDDRIRIAGTKGVLEVLHGNVLLINEDRAGVQEVPLLPARELFAEFMGQVSGDENCSVSAEQSFMVTEASLKARMSADTGRVISI